MEQKAASNGTLSAGGPSPLEDYLFDLRGYLVLEQALEPGLVDDLNSALDDVPPIEPRGWWGNLDQHLSGPVGQISGRSELADPVPLLSTSTDMRLVTPARSRAAGGWLPVAVWLRS